MYRKMENRNWKLHNKVIPLYKPLGFTPLQALDSLRKIKPELKDKKLAYAGRLDPMAEGLLIVLVDDECKKRDTYQILPKTYEVTVLFGFDTDTYDVLGVITDKKTPPTPNISEQINLVLPDFLGSQEQQYPPYSSVRVNGKPLFYWARKGLIDSVTIPTKTIEIKELTMLSSGSYTSIDLLRKINANIRLVLGDFRQKEIIEQWKKELSNTKSSFPYATIRVSATQGSYMRSLAREIGKKVKIPALALSIKRIAVGEFSLNDAVLIPSPIES